VSSQLRLTAYSALATLLAALCLTGVFTNSAWFGPVLAVVLMVSLACAGARAANLPALLVPLAGLLALLLTLVALYARSRAFLGFIPDADAITHLRQLVETGRRDINRFAAPVADLDGIVLITAAGVGFVALVVDTLAVTMSRAALTGLPLLALYAVPAAIVPDGVNWVAFALGAAGYLALLVAESRERVSRWGRSLSGNRGPVPETNPLGAIGRRVGAATVTLALVLPIIVPTLDGQVFGNGSVGFGASNGTNRVRVGNPILDLQADLRRPEAVEVLTYTTTAAQPDYLRMTTLDQFTGRVWQPSPLTVRGQPARAFRRRRAHSGPHRDRDHEPGRPLAAGALPGDRDRHRQQLALRQRDVQCLLHEGVDQGQVLQRAEPRDRPDSRAALRRRPGGAGGRCPLSRASGESPADHRRHDDGDHPGCRDAV
jgi:hypothetical protein